MRKVTFRMFWKSRCKRWRKCLNRSSRNFKRRTRRSSNKQWHNTCRASNLKTEVLLTIYRRGFQTFSALANSLNSTTNKRCKSNQCENSRRLVWEFCFLRERNSIQPKCQAATAHSCRQKTSKLPSSSTQSTSFRTRFKNCLCS